MSSRLDTESAPKSSSGKRSFAWPWNRVDRDVPERFQSAVREQQIEYVYSTIKVQLVSNPIVGLFAIWLLSGLYPLHQLLAWFAMLLLVVASRYWVWQGYWKAKQQKIVQQHAWGLWFAYSNVLGGLVWGALVFFFYNLAHPLESAILVIIAMGFIAAAFSSHSAFFPAYFAFSMGVTSLAFLRLILIGGRAHFAMAGMTATFFLVILAYARTAQTQVRRAIATRLHAEELNQELMAKQRELIVAKESAEKASRAKALFLASASHDLRQPLHALRLYVDVLQARACDVALQPLIKGINVTTDALEGLFSNLLELSKADAHVIEPDVRAVKLKVLLDRIHVESRYAALEKGLVYRTRCRDFTVMADEALLERIVRNLVTNAIRYTDEGGVLVGCRLRGGHVRIEVWDTGIGIARGHLGRIFDEFQQLHNPGRDRTKGLGLGLAIAERLAKLFGAGIEVKSKEGRGSRFAVIVPLAESPVSEPTERESAGNANPIARPSVEGVRLLLVDDDHEILQAMQVVLRDWGCEAILGGSLEEVSTALGAWEEGPDVIVTDYRLRNGVLGTEVIRKVRGQYGKALPAIIVTGDISPKRLQDAAGVGAIVLHKPIKAARLRMLVEQVSEPEHGGGGAGSWKSS